MAASSFTPGGQRTGIVIPLGDIHTDEHVRGGLGTILHQETLPRFGRMRRCPPVPTPQPPLRTSPTTSVHVPLRDRRHPTTAGDITPQAISVTGGHSPARRGEQPAPMFTHQSYLTR